MTQPNTTLRLKLQVPPRDRKALSVCETSVPALQAWVSDLPLANVGAASRDVYQALQEVTRLHVDLTDRLRMLETLRPTVYHLEKLLAHRFLNRQVLLSELERKTARLSSALMAALATGYKVAFVEALRAGETEHLVVALHRAISELSRILLRRCQLYAPPLERLWLDLNQLYAAAESRGLLDRRISDEFARDGQGMTVHGAWCRAALLWSADPNKLRQRDIGTVHEQLELWADLARMGPADGEGIFLLDLGTDRGPSYRTFFREPPRELTRSLDPSALVAALRRYLEDPETAELPVTRGPLRRELLENLINSWGVLSERAHERAAASGEVELCLGLRGLHHHTSGAQSFERQLYGDSASLARQETNPFLVDHRKQREADDVWSNAFDVGGARMPENAGIIDPGRTLFRESGGEVRDEPVEDVPTHRNAIVDASPGGYCLRWTEAVPGALQAGELVGVRERPDYDWSAAVVRWIRTDREGVTQMGLELLAPRVAPVGARVIQKKGGPSEYMRALLVPRNDDTGRPDTLLTPKVPFAEGQKVHVNQNGEERRAQLREKVAQTDSFNLFAFRLLDEPRSALEGGPSLLG